MFFIVFFYKIDQQCYGQCKEAYCLFMQLQIDKSEKDYEKKKDDFLIK